MVVPINIPCIADNWSTQNVKVNGGSEGEVGKIFARRWITISEGNFSEGEKGGLFFPFWAHFSSSVTNFSEGEKGGLFFPFWAHFSSSVRQRARRGGAPGEGGIARRAPRGGNGVSGFHSICDRRRRSFAVSPWSRRRPGPGGSWGELMFRLRLKVPRCQLRGWARR